MVTIVNYKEKQRDDGTSFFLLEIQGGIEMVQSQATGNYYATTKKATIPATFGEEMCLSLIGQQMAGNIEKEECEPYAYLVKETGEEIILKHRWVYSPENVESIKLTAAQEQTSKPVCKDFVPNTHSFAHSLAS